MQLIIAICFLWRTLLISHEHVGKLTCLRAQSSAAAGCVRPAWAWTYLPVRVRTQTGGVKVPCIWTPFHHFMMVAKVLAEGKRLRLAMASQEGVIARYRPCLPTGRWRKPECKAVSRPVCHAGCSFPGEITGGGNRYPKKVPASSGRAFAGRWDTKPRKVDKEREIQRHAGQPVWWGEEKNFPYPIRCLSLQYHDVSIEIQDHEHHV